MSDGISIIIPVRNRRETSLLCLRRLSDYGMLARSQVIVVDDGSNDGTPDAIAKEFPGVELLRGDGSLWWTGAIELGMRKAFEQNPAFFLWLNDDTLPAPEAIDRLIEVSKQQSAICGGVAYLPGDSTPSYGGFLKGGHSLGDMLVPGNDSVPCDALSGNLLCIPRFVVDRIGLPNPRQLPHGFADIDYVLRARRAGIPAFLVGSARAEAQANLSLNYRSWMHSDVPLSEWWRQLGRRGSFMYFPAMLRFYTRHWGIAGLGYVLWQPLKLLLISILRLCFGQARLRRWFGAGSKAWIHERRHTPSS